MKWTTILTFTLLAFASTGSRAAEVETFKLAEGVYGIKGSGESINTGVVVGERGVFVYSCSLDSYEERLEAIRKLAGGKPIRFLANGHTAPDDTGCNHLFAEQGAVILGNTVFAKDLAVSWPRWQARQLQQGTMKRLLEGKSASLALPTVIFEKQLTLDLGSHMVELHFVGRGHTPDNTVAWLSKEKILFVNDLLFYELHPSAGARADTVNWQRLLRQLASWNPVSVVPGHGRFFPGNGTKPFEMLDRYFEVMREKVTTLMKTGKSLEEIKQGIERELKEYATWERKRAIPGTAEQVYRELTGKQ